MSLYLKIGLGGIINGELLTFDFTMESKVSRLNPYACEIEGRCFKYGFRRNFLTRNYPNIEVHPYGNERPLGAISFPLKRHIVYEYKRFAGATLGEIEEGYFVVLSDRILELEYDEVCHWIGTAKEKEKQKSNMKPHFANLELPFAKDNIDF